MNNVLEKAMLEKPGRRQRFRRRAQDVLGMDHEEWLHRERVTRGTGQQRQRPRHQSVNPNRLRADITDAEMRGIDRLFAALSRSVASETDYPFDGDQQPLFATGEALTVELDGVRYDVQLSEPYLAMRTLGTAPARDRWRYRVSFDRLPDRPSLMMTMQQIVRIHVKPIAAPVDVPLLPSQVPVRELFGVQFSSADRFIRAEQRVVMNQVRQQNDDPVPYPVLVCTCQVERSVWQ